MMKKVKFVLTVTMFLVVTQIVIAQPEDRDSDFGNPLTAKPLMALYACEEDVIKSNISSQNNEKSLMPIIKKSCAQQIDAASLVCRHESKAFDDCRNMIDTTLSNHFTDVVIGIMLKKK